MIENLSSYFAKSLNEFTQNRNVSVDHVRYVISLYLHVLIIFIGAILIALFTGKVEEAIISFFSFGILRRYSGGFHLKTLEGCAIFTILLITVVTLSNVNEILLVNLLALIIVLIFSKKSKQLILISLLLITVNFFISSEVIALSYLAQALTLISFKEVRL